MFKYTRQTLALGFGLAMMFWISSCGDSDDAPPMANPGVIESFEFRAEDNPTLEADIEHIIEEERITGRLPYNADLDSLIPHFEIDGLFTEVNGERQTSGESTLSFKELVEYYVTGEDSSTTRYIIDVQLFTGLPILSITTENGVAITSRDEYVDGAITIYGGREYEDLDLQDFRIRGRGNSTWGAPKKPYQIRFDDKESILDMPKDKKWILLANYSDKTMLRNELAFNMSRLSSLDWTPDSRFIELILNGEYQGTYQLTQKVEETSNRVDIGNDGFLLEVDQIDRLNPDDVYFESDRYLFNIKEPNLDRGDREYEYIEEFINRVENTIFSSDFKDPDVGYRSLTDVESFADWYIINELTRNNDAIFFSSVYINVVPGELLKMGPVWDFDISMGNINYNGNEATEGFWIKKADWIERLFEDEYFVQIVNERMQYFSDRKAEIFGQLAADATYIEDAQTQNFEKWMILGEYVWPNYVYYDTYAEELEYLESWLDERWTWMEGALAEL